MKVGTPASTRAGAELVGRDQAGDGGVDEGGLGVGEPRPAGAVVDARRGALAWPSLNGTSRATEGGGGGGGDGHGGDRGACGEQAAAAESRVRPCRCLRSSWVDTVGQSACEGQGDPAGASSAARVGARVDAQGRRGCRHVCRCTRAARRHARARRQPGRTMSSARTHASNCSPVSLPEAIAASRSFRPLACAVRAICAAAS